MIKLLILSCGTNANYHIAKILKEKFTDDFMLIGTDVNDFWLIQTKNYLDEFYKVPYSNSDEYSDSIEKIDYILPSFDVDQMLFNDASKLLIKCGVKSLSTPYESLRIYANKKNMNSFLLKNGFKVPYDIQINELADNENYFIKTN